MASISEILIEQGRVLADQRRRSGERRGAIVTALGQIPVQIVADRQASRQAAQQQAAAAEEARLKRAAEARANADLELRQNADARAQGTVDQARLDEERGRAAVMGWMKQHAASLKPEESARMEAILQMPGGAKHLVESLMKAPEPFTLSKDQVRYNPDGTVQASNVQPDAPKPVTFGAPQPYMLNGKRILARAGSDNQMYDMRGQPIADAIQPDVPPSTAQGPQPGWQWVVRDGKEVYTNRVKDGDRPQNVRVKATEDERKAAGFYARMSDAMQTIDELEGQINEKELYQIQTLPQEKLIGMVNRNQLSEAAKRYLRAFEQFTEARLRPDSGAAINDSEYARDRRTYAKQYGETPKLAEDRKRAREVAKASLKKRAGVALDDANETAQPKGGPIVVTAPDGSKHAFETQAQADAFKKLAGM